ncbi:MAG: hypothetical protein KF712_16175 [Akkermansiaceae bacterium]|nr:hypothetical protein [Akkermansiaceae bacterium]
MTTTKEEGGKLIRMDAIGRVRTSASQREALLDAYGSSGLSGPEFAARHGVKYQTFATWLQKRKRRTGGYPSMAAPDGGSFPLLLAEVECAEGPPASTTPLEVRLPGGASIAIHGGAQLGLAVELLRQLARPC